MSTDQSRRGGAQQQIAEACNAYFDRFEIRVTPDDVAVGVHRTVFKNGWAITYRVDPDAAGTPGLEF